MIPLEIKKKERLVYITDMMQVLGMQAHLRGYHYLREAICMSVENMELVGSITKLMYPEIAKIYHTSNEKVERAIRSVIEISWQRGDVILFEEILGYSRICGNKRPTNSEFILAATDKVLLAEKKKLCARVNGGNILTDRKRKVDKGSVDL